MCPRRLVGSVVLLVAFSAPIRARPLAPEAPVEPPASAPALTMAPAVACRDIKGYEDYERLPDAALTADEKLLVYYRPLGFRTERDGSLYRIHLVQDAQIRRKGDKTVLRRKEKLLDYDAKMPESDRPIYLRNSIALKGLMPGEYMLDIILRDALAPGSSVTQSLLFRINPVAETETPAR